MSEVLLADLLTYDSQQTTVRRGMLTQANPYKRIASSFPSGSSGDCESMTCFIASRLTPTGHAADAL